VVQFTSLQIPAVRFTLVLVPKLNPKICRNFEPFRAASMTEGEMATTTGGSYLKRVYGADDWPDAVTTTAVLPSRDSLGAKHTTV
jgi:hypothetical protein